MSQRLSFTRFHTALVATTLMLLAPWAVADSLGTITQAYQKMLHSKFRAQTTITDEKGQVTHSTTEFDTVERIHTSSERGEFVLVPEGMWMKTGGSWNKPPVDMSSMVKRFLPLSEDIVRSAKNVTDDGATTWQGQPAHAFSYDSEISVMSIHVTSHNKLYLNASGQVIGSEADSTAMGRKTHAVQNIAYDQTIHVSAPN